MSAITVLLGGEAEGLLSYKCKGIDKAMLALPGPDFIDRRDFFRSGIRGETEIG